jgi:hypothetical protein
VVILGRDEHVRIERADLCSPRFGVCVAVLAHDRRHGLVEEREVVVRDIDQLKLGITALFREVVYPPGDSRIIAPRARAPRHHSDS